MITLDSGVWRVYLHGVINVNSVSETTRHINGAINNADVKSIWLFISSGGGRVDAGLGLYDWIQKAKKIKPINTLAFGQCASMATLILQAGTRRYSTPNTTIMIHPTSFNGTDNRWSEAGMIEAAAYNQHLGRRVVNLMAKHVGLPVAEYRKLHDPAKHMTATTALRFGTKGLIDEII